MEKTYIHELCLVLFPSSFSVCFCFSPSPLELYSSPSRHWVSIFSHYKSLLTDLHAPILVILLSVIHSQSALCNIQIKFYHSIPKTVYELLIIACGIWQFVEGLLTLHQKLVFHFPWHMAMLCFLVSLAVSRWRARGTIRLSISQWNISRSDACGSLDRNVKTSNVPSSMFFSFYVIFQSKLRRQALNMAMLASAYVSKWLHGALSLYLNSIGLECKCEVTKICAFTCHSHSTFLSNTTLRVIQSVTHSLPHHHLLFLCIALVTLMFPLYLKY